MSGYLERGSWIQAEDWKADEHGAFRRERARFRHRVSSEGLARFRPEPGRYHLFVSLACPWAHRTLLIRALKGLERVISVSITQAVMGGEGWAFGSEPERPEPEPLLGVTHLRDVYLMADPDYSGRVTVPVLWDKRQGTIVSNESREILRMLDHEFDPWSERSVCLCPGPQCETIDATIDAIYAPINNGVYRAGFARTQAAYEHAFEELFAALDHWDDVLGRRRYLCGAELSEADICMFTTLIRFDPVYYVHFKCNRQRIADFEHLRGYVQELYQLPHVAALCNFEHIKQHYYRSHPRVNPRRIVARGPDLGWLHQPHGRERLAGGPPGALYALA